MTDTYKFYKLYIRIEGEVVTILVTKIIGISIKDEMCFQ